MATCSYGVAFLVWSNHQMGLLTSFHILFDMPKEDIGNRLTVTNQRERGQKGYLRYPGRLSPKEHSTL